MAESSLEGGVGPGKAKQRPLCEPWQTWVLLARPWVWQAVTDRAAPHAPPLASEAVLAQVARWEKHEGSSSGQGHPAIHCRTGNW
jgi:hypothetical protein